MYRNNGRAMCGFRAARCKLMAREKLCEQYVTSRANEVHKITTKYSFRLRLGQWKMIWQESTTVTLRTWIVFFSLDNSAELCRVGWKSDSASAETSAVATELCWISKERVYVTCLLQSEVRFAVPRGTVAMATLRCWVYENRGSGRPCVSSAERSLTTQSPIVSVWNICEGTSTSGSDVGRYVNIGKTFQYVTATHITIQGTSFNTKDFSTSRR